MTDRKGVGYTTHTHRARCMQFGRKVYGLLCRHPVFGLAHKFMILLGRCSDAARARVNIQSVDVKKNAHWARTQSITHRQHLFMLYYAGSFCFRSAVRWNYIFSVCVFLYVLSVWVCFSVCLCVDQPQRGENSAWPHQIGCSHSRARKAHMCTYTKHTRSNIRSMLVCVKRSRTQAAHTHASKFTQ